MTFDFDRVFDRRTSDSNKWRKYPADVLPLWVADMDFPSPPAVVQALRARVEQGFFGYLMEKPELHEVVAERVAKRYDWRVSPDAIVPLPGVIAGFNLALRALTSPGDGLLVQTPVYPPILRAAGNHGLTRGEHTLTRGGSQFQWQGLHVRLGVPGADVGVAPEVVRAAAASLRAAGAGPAAVAEPVRWSRAIGGPRSILIERVVEGELDFLVDEASYLLGGAEREARDAFGY